MSLLSQEVPRAGVTDCHSQCAHWLRNDTLQVVRRAGRCGERTERCQWQRKRSERVAAVKILSVRRKAAQKFWAPQQGHLPLRNPIGKHSVGADASVRPQKNPPKQEISGEFDTSLGRTGSSAPTGFLKYPNKVRRGRCPHRPGRTHRFYGNPRRIWNFPWAGRVARPYAMWGDFWAESPAPTS